ncbi:MAG: hypothetical protein JWP44_4954 [Mucilaginibacter sp.]|nr:hypothetical protein [Mucilaginibacter sp.]
MTKVKLISQRNNNQFVYEISKILPRDNGSQAGVNALAESLKRGDAYLKEQSTNRQEAINV